MDGRSKKNHRRRRTFHLDKNRKEQGQRAAAAAFDFLPSDSINFFTFPFQTSSLIFPLVTIYLLLFFFSWFFAFRNVSNKTLIWLYESFPWLKGLNHYSHQEEVIIRSVVAFLYYNWRRTVGRFCRRLPFVKRRASEVLYFEIAESHLRFLTSVIPVVSLCEFSPCSVLSVSSFCWRLMWGSYFFIRLFYRLNKTRTKKHHAQLINWPFVVNKSQAANVNNVGLSGLLNEVGVIGNNAKK